MAQAVRQEWRTAIRREWYSASVGALAALISVNRFWA